MSVICLANLIFFVLQMFGEGYRSLSFSTTVLRTSKIFVSNLKIKNETETKMITVTWEVGNLTSSLALSSI